MISALILTYNEENILASCLDALDFVDSILVYDSYSTDATLKIARGYKAKIIQRTFDNYANQRNAALSAVSKTYDWILMIDADEIITPELRKEILENINKNKDITMYRVRRKDMFQDKWIKQSSGYPTWFPRVFKNGHVEVKRTINEEYFTDGAEGLLKEHLIHYPFNKGLSWWFDKHNRYSTMEANRMYEELQNPINFKNLFHKSPIVRRKTQKLISFRMPFRPLFIFFAFYVLKGGFLNGSSGYIFCRLRQTYEFMIDVKYKELKRKRKDK